jgi:predicted DNA-binding transcriptional regulator YafY
MPINKNALIRYKVIDSCLQRRNRKWTLEDIIEAVSDALFEYEGTEISVSKRTIQADIQIMRSDKLGYFAPIIVLDKKYYTYEDPKYSITNIPVSEADLARMNEAVEMLKQFKGFGHFNQLNEVVQKLEDHVYSSTKKTEPIIDFEKNDNLKGIHFLDIIFNAVKNKKPITLTYKSFTAKNSSTFLFHVWWLKEFKNRWFAVGVKNAKLDVLNLALDRILEVNINYVEPYVFNENYSPETFYKAVIGVTVSPNLRIMIVKIFVAAAHAPYVLTKPLHPTQIVLEEIEKGVIIQIQVQHNFELEREIISFAEHMTVLEPANFRNIIAKRLKRAAEKYIE